MQKKEVLTNEQENRKVVKVLKLINYNLIEDKKSLGRVSVKNKRSQIMPIKKE